MIALRLAALLTLSLFAAGAARAHPHVWVEAVAELQVDNAGRLVGVRHRWTFDEVFSQFAKQGLDTNRDGRFSREELAGLAEVNVTSLQEFKYFTQVTVGEQPSTFNAPTEYWLEHDDASGQLTLVFVLPLKEPAGGRGRELQVLVHDPEYFVAFDMAETNPVRVFGRAGCRTDLTRPKELDEAQAAELSLIPPSTRELPAQLRSLTVGLANRITLTCP